MTPDDQDGVLSLGARFTNIEAALERIEHKLDSKVEISTFESLQRRVELLESGETPLGRYMIKQFEQMQNIVGDIATHGSPEAQEAVKEVRELRVSVERLERDGSQSRAVIQSNQERVLKNIRLAGLAGSLLAASGWIYTLILHVH